MLLVSHWHALQNETLMRSADSTTLERHQRNSPRPQGIYITVQRKREERGDSHERTNLNLTIKSSPPPMAKFNTSYLVAPRCLTPQRVAKSDRLRWVQLKGQ